MRYRPRILTVGLILAIIVIVAFAACIVVYAFPPQRVPQRADVVLILGPADAWRFDLARQLIDESKAGALLVSMPFWSRAPRLTAEMLGVPVTYFSPRPFTTAGEVKELHAQMRAHGWTTATIITFTPHIARTRFIAGRVIPRGVTVIGKRLIGDGPISVRYWLYSFAYQTAAFVKAIVIGRDG